MKRLFKVCMKGSNKPVDGAFFENKMDAKGLRDAKGGVECGFRVSLGPDHIGKHSGGGVPRMRRQPK